MIVLSEVNPGSEGVRGRASVETVEKTWVSVNGNGTQTGQLDGLVLIDGFDESRIPPQEYHSP